jgi:glycosyltransferase involved in cell wall biosynthesis
MLQSSLTSRGNQVDTWSPEPRVYKFFARQRIAKWAGYVDQYIIFPFLVRRRLKLVPADTLFVFCDQAMGPWVPLVRHRPHVVHAHDLLALRSALGHFPENPTSLTGRLYQRYIRRGFKQARHFISVSKKTKGDLQLFGQIDAITSEVIYNGLNYPYTPMPPDEAHETLHAAGMPDVPEGMLLHVGGNQWYKNLTGVIAIYAQYSIREARPLPLWCVSPPPDSAAKTMLEKVSPLGSAVFVRNIDNRTLQAAYSLARAFLFPSLSEGFGWPLIEAQACGCPVVTTDEPPMNEVAGPSAIYLPRLRSREDIDSWASHGATQLVNLLRENAAERMSRRERGIAWTRNFDSNSATEAYTSIYGKIICNS